jgi:phage tail tape-measure protein
MDQDAANTQVHLDTERVVRIYNKMRDKRAQLKREFDAADNAIKEQQKTLEAAMLNFLNANSAKSANTAAGQFYWQEKVIPRGDDWNAFYAFIAKEGAFDALERRIKTTFVKEYMDAHQGELPPGVSVLREREIRVRTSN